jgi:hypothetical protein
MVRAVGPRVVEEVACVVDLIVSQVLEGQHAIDDAGGDAVVGIGISQGLGALEVLLSDVG